VPLVFIPILLLADLSAALAFFGQTETKRERRLREESHTAEPAVSYEQVQENFLREDYSGTEKLSENYLSGTDRSKADDVSYLQALSLLKLGRIPEARVKLNEIERSSRSEDLRSQAAVSIGDSYELQNDVLNAYQRYGAALKKYPGSDEAPYTQGKITELSKKMGRPVTEFAAQSVKKDAVVSRTYAASKPVLLHQVFVEENPFYAVQVGSFSKERNARLLMRRLARSKYDAYLDDRVQDGLFRVRVGKFAAREDAVALESRLKKDGYPTKIRP
jgi:cell division septation protein DedD